MNNKTSRQVIYTLIVFFIVVIMIIGVSYANVINEEKVMSPSEIYLKLYDKKSLLVDYSPINDDTGIKQIGNNTYDFEVISNVLTSKERKNIWVKKLRKMLEENIVHQDINNKDFKNFLSIRNLKLVNNTTVDSLIEIKYYSYQIKKYLELLLNIINDKDILKEDFYNLFKNIDCL